MLLPTLPDLPSETERISPADLKMIAAPFARNIATELCGEPNRRMSNATCLRFGRRGSLSVDIRPATAGVWCDHEAGEGGSIIDLAARQLGLSFPAACDWIANRCGVGDGAIDADDLARRRAEMAALAALQDAEIARERAARVDAAWAIWQASAPPGGTLAQVYLTARRCWHPWLGTGHAVRFTPACPMDDGGTYPAMVAAMTDALTGEFTGIHRTHLAPDGSGKGAREKRMLGTARGAVVRLRDEPGSAACFAEGIETTLSTPALIGALPPKVIATLSAGTMRTLPAMQGVENAVIMADMDEAGLDAAAMMAGRYADAGKFWSVYGPPQGFKDANDALTGCGQEKAPPKAGHIK
ncbi:DUF7146 domain-containing protein [Hoeflea halophila]|nr:toprim domain-containing protein [Hoeflea halophila]